VKALERNGQHRSISPLCNKSQLHIWYVSYVSTYCCTARTFTFKCLHPLKKKRAKNDARVAMTESIKLHSELLHDFHLK